LDNCYWSLEELFPSFESEGFQKCFEDLKKEVIKINSWAEENFSNKDDALKKIETYISMQNNFSKFQTLTSFASLSLSVDSNNNTARRLLGQLENIFTDITVSDNKFYEFIDGIEDLDGLVSSSEVLKSHEFYLKEIKEGSKHRLSEKEEYILAKVRQTGSGAFSKQQEFLTSNLLAEFDGGLLTLSEIRNKAYDENASVREGAYFAELGAYKKIEGPAAFSLNAIKGEVITISELRGFESPLDMALYYSRMDRQTLEAMFSAIRKCLPMFIKYFDKKAGLLGHKNGLPFYDLFAPVGKVWMRFTYPQAQAFVLDNFYNFSENLGSLAERAFKNNWVDAFPRKGKVGGAFCSNIHPIGESRILTNFTGSFNDCLTIAHELGHAYHGNTLMGEAYLNSGYSMPIAETASTMCESIITKAAIKSASKDEALVILENDIMGSSQVIVDIYSRFLFEDEVFNRRKGGPLPVEEFKEIMVDSQIKAYGDGLDKQFLHPYMWVCKPHYYFADSNYYNFPYAYGLLFSKGLYAKYLESGPEFVKLYDEMLSKTGKNNLYDVGKIAGIDIRDEGFWLSSLKMVEGEIGQFVNM
jgi:pepF/M3 family oligoendopeptidase